MTTMAAKKVLAVVEDLFFTVKINEAAKRAGGVWTVLSAPAAWRDSAHLLPAEQPALAAISRRVKTAFDPGGILNPGRMFAGV